MTFYIITLFQVLIRTHACPFPVKFTFSRRFSDGSSFGGVYVCLALDAKNTTLTAITCHGLPSAAAGRLFGFGAIPEAHICCMVRLNSCSSQLRLGVRSFLEFGGRKCGARRADTPPPWLDDTRTTPGNASGGPHRRKRCKICSVYRHYRTRSGLRQEFRDPSNNLRYYTCRLRSNTRCLRSFEMRPMKLRNPVVVRVYFEHMNTRM